MVVETACRRFSSRHGELEDPNSADFYAFHNPHSMEVTVCGVDVVNGVVAVKSVVVAQA